MESVRALAKRMWEMICNCVQASCEKVDHAFRQVKAFYDNLSEKLKEKMIQTRKMIHETWCCVQQRLSDGINWLGAKAVVLLSCIFKFFEYVQSFFCLAREASEATKTRYNCDSSWISRVKRCLSFLLKLLDIISMEPAEVGSEAADFDAFSILVEFLRFVRAFDCVVREISEENEDHNGKHGNGWIGYVSGFISFLLKLLTRF